MAELAGIPKAEKRLFARRLRRRQTPAEQALWQFIRRDALGVRFRRQHIVLGWIADFYSPRARLVIEVDGGYHLTRVKEDAIRDRAMRNAGLKVLRFTNDDVDFRMDDVIAAIRMAIPATI